MSDVADRVHSEHCSIGADVSLPPIATGTASIFRVPRAGSFDVYTKIAKPTCHLSRNVSGPTPTDSSRRQFVLGTATIAATGFAGCLGSSDRPEPVALTERMSCDQCGMVITQQPGPSGQTYYQDNSPEGHDPPARFCSTVCAYRHRFATGDRGWTPQVTYLTDYATVDYSVREEGGARVISAHLAAENFAVTEALEVVIGSGIEGAMGPAIVPFGTTSAAEEFVSTYGGEIIAAEDISSELVAQQ